MYTHHALYQAQTTETAGPAQLVLMLFDGALAAMSRARVAQRAGGAVEAVNRELQRAQDIVSELQVTLDLEQGGDIAVSLHLLYRYCLEQLIEANVRKDLAHLDIVETVLTDLRDAWDSACCQAAVAGR